MPILKTSHPHSRIRVLSGAPSTALVRDAVYIPVQPSLWYDKDDGYGLFSCDGHLLPESAYWWGPNEDTTLGQSQTVSIPEKLDQTDELLIYGGTMQHHYGHFLLSCFPRYAHKIRGARFLIHGRLSIDEWFSFGFVKTFFNAIGLDREDFVLFKKPTRISNIVVPGTSLIERLEAHTVFSDLLTEVSNKLLGEMSPSVNTKPLYLTKQHLTGALSNCRNEAEATEILSRNGFDIVAPEQLSIPDQIRLFEDRSMVFGLMGSAFHTAALARRCGKLVLISRDNLKSGQRENYPLLDALRGLDTLYVHPDPEMTNLHPEPGFSAAYAMSDPKQFASDLITIASQLTHAT